MANKDKENKIKKFTKEAIGKTLNQFNKEIGMADLVEINKNQDRILNGILSQVNDENTEKTEKSNIITLDNSTDGIVELKEIQGDTNVNVSKIEEMPITHDIGDKEGNVFTLNEIPKGAISIGEIQGNTMVNCNKDDEKELVLMKDLSTQGYSNITLTEGVDGGLVDVALEGNTMVNVCDQKDPVAITKSYTVENGNHVALQGKYDGKCRPVVTGNTLWIDNDTEEVLTAFDDSKNLRLQSSFEDKVVTQEMVDAGEELADNLGKYKVDYVVTGKNKFDKSKALDGYEIKSTNIKPNVNWFVTDFIPVIPNTSYKISGKNTGSSVIYYDKNKQVLEAGEGGTSLITVPTDAKYVRLNGLCSTQKDTFQIEEGSVATPYEPYKEYKKTFYLNSPLLEGDTIEQQGDNVVHVHRYGKVVLDGNTNIPTAFNMGNDCYRWNFYDDKIGNVNSLEIYTINNKYPDVSAQNMWDNHSEGVAQNGGGNLLLLYLEKYSDGSNNSKQALMSELQSNPVTVVYQLQTPQYEVISQNDTILCDSYVNGHLDVDSAIPIEKVKFADNLLIMRYLYPSTNYTIQFESDNIGKMYYFTGTPFNTVLNLDINKGLNKFNIVTKEAVDITKGYISGIGFNASNIVVTEATDQDFGYFEGMKSVGECEDLEVVSCNKNLWNVTQDTPFYSANRFGEKLTTRSNTITADGDFKIVEHNNSSFGRGAILKLEIGKIYTLSATLKSLGGANSIFFQIANPTNHIWHRPLCSEEGKRYSVTFTTDINTNYVMFNPVVCFGTPTSDVLLSDIQLEEGNTATDYIPHARNTQTLTHEPLRAVGDIKDKYVLIDGKWYIERNCGVRAYQEGDIDNYITDKINTVYPLSTPTYEPIEYNPFTVYSDITHISNNSTIPCNMTIKNTGYNCLLKPSTTYTVSSNLGLNTVTTPSVLSEDCLRFYDTDTSTVTTMKDVTILEGDYTTGKPLPSHFSGIESAFEQEYDEAVGKYKVKAKVVGKNLFEGYHKLINIIPNTDYYVSSANTTGATRLRFNLYDKKMNEIKDYSIPGFYYNNNGYYQGNSNKTIINFPINTRASYIKIHYANTVAYTNFQIELGTKATPYEPYKENYIEFYINEPLRGIGNVKDKVYVKDDKVVVERNCGSVTLDGSETDWVMRTDSKGNNAFLLWNDAFKEAHINSNCISNNFSENRDGGLIKTEKTMRITEYSSLQRLFLVPPNSYRSSLELFKQYLSENPTTVVYQLAEPTYEEVEYSSNRLILNTFNNESFNNSTLFLDTNISPKLSFKPLYEELVYVKNSTKYYIQFNAVGSGEVVINLGGTELTTEIVEGYNYIPITTPSESTNLMVISGQGITISEVVVSEVICGGYYKGLQSCFEEHMENGKYRVLLRGIALDGSKVNGIKLYINEPLRGIGDNKDRLCIKNGKLMVERKCGEAIFDGSNYIQSMDTSIDTKKRWLIYQDSSIKDVSDSQVTTINDKYCDISANDTWYNKEGISQNSMQHAIHIYLERYSDGSDESKQALISELQQNPVTVVYQLAEQTYEEATNEYGLPIVFEGYENGIVYIDSAVTPTTHIKYTSNNQLATTLSEAEEQNIATQEDINMNVITYMMDIDMILTDMEMSNDTSVMAVRRDNSNENMLDRMSEEDKKVYQDNTVVMLEKMITAQALEKEDIEGRVNMYYNKNRISKEQYNYLKSLL